MYWPSGSLKCVSRMNGNNTGRDVYFIRVGYHCLLHVCYISVICLLYACVRRVPKVRVQDALKQDLGVMATDDARQLAAADGVDVVLINEAGDPPVVRLVQFGKYKFEQERAAKQKQKSSKG